MAISEAIAGVIEQRVREGPEVLEDLTSIELVPGAQVLFLTKFDEYLGSDGAYQQEKMLKLRVEGFPNHHVEVPVTVQDKGRVELVENLQKGDVILVLTEIFDPLGQSNGDSKGTYFNPIGVAVLKGELQVVWGRMSLETDVPIVDVCDKRRLRDLGRALVFWH